MKRRDFLQLAGAAVAAPMAAVRPKPEPEPVTECVYWCEREQDYVITVRLGPDEIVNIPAYMVCPCWQVVHTTQKEE